MQTSKSLSLTVQNIYQPQKSAKLALKRIK